MCAVDEVLPDVDAWENAMILLVARPSTSSLLVGMQTCSASTTHAGCLRERTLVEQQVRSPAAVFVAVGGLTHAAVCRPNTKRVLESRLLEPCRPCTCTSVLARTFPARAGRYRSLVLGRMRRCLYFFSALMVLRHSLHFCYESATSAIVTSPTLVSCTSGDVAGRIADRGRL